MTEKTVEPNYEKQQRYARAHERLKLALDGGFYIEAAMNCESIITDRLHSHLHWRVTAAQTLTPQMVKERAPKLRGELKFEGHTSLGFLIKVFSLDFDDLGQEGYAGLPKDLDEWRILRNKVAHAITYTAPGSKSYTEHFDWFLARAEFAAVDGNKLAARLNAWDRAARRRHGKDIPTSGD